MKDLTGHLLGGIAWTSAVAGVSLSPRRAFPASVYGDRKSGVFVLAGDRYRNIDYVRDCAGEALRRDFTVNALFMNPFTGVVDHVGGHQDCNKPAAVPSPIHHSERAGLRPIGNIV